MIKKYRFFILWFAFVIPLQCMAIKTAYLTMKSGYMDMENNETHILLLPSEHFQSALTPQNANEFLKEKTLREIHEHFSRVLTFAFRLLENGKILIVQNSTQQRRIDERPQAVDILIRLVLNNPELGFNFTKETLITLCPDFKFLYEIYHLGRLTPVFDRDLPNVRFVNRTLSESRNYYRERRYHIFMMLLNKMTLVNPYVSGILSRAVSSCTSPYPLKLDPSQERVAIIGGGYTGVMTAIFLSSLKGSVDGLERPLYEVHLYEQNEHLMTEASLMPGRLHLGGEYPLDAQTSHDCLRTALLFKQIFPNERLYTKIPAVAYVLSKHSRNMTPTQLQENFERIQKDYEGYYNLLQQEHGVDTPQRLFGTPQELYEELTDLRDFPEATAGYLIHERGFHSAFLGAYLEALLEKRGVIIHRGKKVTAHMAHFPRDDSMHLTIGKEQYHHIVNATNVKFKLTDQGIVPCIDGSQAMYHKRAILLADIRDCRPLPKVGQKKEECAFFGLEGEDGGMISPFNSSLALLYLPSIEGAYVGSSFVSYGVNAEPLHDGRLSSELQDVDRQKRTTNILQTLQERYPAFRGAKPLRLHMSGTLNNTDRLQQRSHMKPYRPAVSSHGTREVFNRDWSVAISSKATYASLTALQAVATVIHGSRERGYFSRVDIQPLQKVFAWLEDIYDNGVTPRNINKIPPQFLFKEAFSDLTERAKEYAKVRGLPQSFVEESEVSR